MLGHRVGPWEGAGSHCAVVWSRSSQRARWMLAGRVLPLAPRRHVLHRRAGLAHACSGPLTRTRFPPPPPGRPLQQPRRASLVEITGRRKCGGFGCVRRTSKATCAIPDAVSDRGTKKQRPDWRVGTEVPQKVRRMAGEAHDAMASRATDRAGEG